MKYDKLVQFIREEGCRVYVYNKKSSIYGDSRGTFDHNEHGPIICVAGDLPIESKVETLLHEYGHYCQYQNGFMQYLDGIYDAYDTNTDWIAGRIELTDRELLTTRNAILTMEYDAERHGHKWGKILKPEGFNSDYYLRGAQAYMAAIKLSFFYREEFGSPNRKLFDTVELTNEQLYAPLEEEEAEVLKVASIERAKSTEAEERAHLGVEIVKVVGA